MQSKNNSSKLKKNAVCVTDLTLHLAEWTTMKKKVFIFQTMFSTNVSFCKTKVLENWDYVTGSVEHIDRHLVKSQIGIIYIFAKTRHE